MKKRKCKVNFKDKSNFNRKRRTNFQTDLRTFLIVQGVSCMVRSGTTVIRWAALGNKVVNVSLVMVWDHEYECKESELNFVYYMVPPNYSE